MFAAASLTDALEEIAKNYEARSGDRVVFNFGASSILARQIEQGAPADLFLSADEEKMDFLARRGLIESRVSVLSNSLVIVTTEKTIRHPRELVNVDSLALAEPSSVPAGIYARKWLQSIGLWDRVAGKVIPTENVRAALAAVEAGNADAAIVYATDARISRKVRVVYAVPRAQTPKISYPFAVVKESEHRHAAHRLLAYLRSRDALAVFAKYGFDVAR